MSTGALTGKIAIVTGASRGIGAAIARRFAAEGARVAIVARTLDPGGALAGSLRDVAAAIAQAGGEALPVQADLSSTADLAHIVDSVMSHWGGIDILVNNAAWSRFPPIWEAQERHIRLAFQMNVITPQLLSQMVTPHLRARGRGWILNISSATADMPPAAPWDFEDRALQYARDGHPTLYGASKSALDRLTKGWALELADSGIAVNALAPVGAVASEGALAVGGWDERDHIEPVEAMAEAALLLCSETEPRLSGEVARSLPLLAAHGVAIRSLDGTAL